MKHSIRVGTSVAAINLATLISFATIAVAPVWAATITNPARLNPGDRFRVMFVTDGIYQAISSDIATYDRYVQAEADAAGLTTNTPTLYPTPSDGLRPDFPTLGDPGLSGIMLGY